jgi:superfamily II DNA/RNA helicase
MDLNIKDKLCFEDFNLPSGLLLGLYAMGFQNGPSDTQALILPYSLPNQLHRNIIVQAKTGTGKTVGDFRGVSIRYIANSL